MYESSLQCTACTASINAATRSLFILILLRGKPIRLRGRDELQYLPDVLKVEESANNTALYIRK